MQEWLQSALIGLAFGTIVSAINHYILLRVLGQKTGDSPGNLQNSVLKGYLFRYVLNIAAMLLVRKNVPMLIATALGLMFSKHALVVKYFSVTPKGKE